MSMLSATAPAVEIAPEITTENPRDSWPAWTDADRWEVAAPGRADDADGEAADADEYRPTADFGARPDAWSEAFHRGLALGLEGEDPAIPAGLTPYESRAFQAGLIAGAREHDREFDRYVDQLEAERMEDAFGEPGAGFHESERVRAIGCIASRMG